MILILLTIFACGEGIVPLPANETSQIDAVILCQEGITINWGTPKEMTKKFNEAIAEIELCVE